MKGPLVVHLAQIPPEGLRLDEPVSAGEVHLDPEESFRLEPGARLSCHIEKGEEESVHVRGRLTAQLSLSCGRCLDPFTLSVDDEIDLFYLPHHAGLEDQEQEDEVELSDHEMVVTYYRGEEIDLGEGVREELVLAVPLKRVCRPECAGLCPTCGKNLNAGPCACPEPEPEIDPRLAGLKGLLGGRS